MSSASEIIKQIKEEDIKYLDVRFTDPKGKMQHVTMDADLVDEDMFADGIMFDGSSIAGWKAINESDMTLIMDPASAHMDPFFAQSTMAATRCLLVLKLSSLYLMTFVFLLNHTIQVSHLIVLSFLRTQLLNMKLATWATAHALKAVTCQDYRGEMLSVIKEMGVTVEKHHHEVAAAQHELGIMFDTLSVNADKMQIYKYAVHQVAHAYGKTATFMPKPVYGDNGTGMHVHQSIWKDGKPTFAGNEYAGLSENCLYYIGGIIKHAKALNAFTNPSTNSYKRLVPGYEAPVLLAYSARNRSASCRIPFGSSPKSKRVEVRFPDPMANPYLAFAAMLMAGLDGINNKIHPGEAMDKDLYDLPPSQLKRIPTVCGSLREALESLQKDNKFLLEGDVFDKDQIDAYIELKMEEVERYEMTPHPVEFDMYYSA